MASTSEKTKSIGIRFIDSDYKMLVDASEKEPCRHVGDYIVKLHHERIYRRKLENELIALEDRLLKRLEEKFDVMEKRFEEVVDRIVGSYVSDE